MVVLCSADSHLLNNKTTDTSTESPVECLYTCRVCLKSFSSTIRHRQHESFHMCHPVLSSCHRVQDFQVHVACKKFGCFRCRRKFFTSSARIVHQKRHLFFKYKSGVVSRSWAKLTKKAYMDRDAQHFTCKECGKGFTYRSCLLAHQRCHKFVTQTQKVLLIYLLVFITACEFWVCKTQPASFQAGVCK